jgi:parallel beta-helix repeat protein
MVFFLVVAALEVLDLIEAEEFIEKFVGAGALAIALTMVLLALWAIMGVKLKLPFKIYQHGITMTTVPFSDALFRRETVIPFERIRRISSEQPKFKGVAVPRLRIEYLDEQGDEKELRLDSSDIDRPLTVIRALKEAVPGKIDGSVEPFLTLEDEAAIGKAAYADLRTAEGLSESLFPVYIVLMFTMMMGTMFGIDAILVENYVTLVYSGIMLLVLLVMYFFARWRVRAIMEESSVVGVSGVSVSQPPWTIMVVRVRNEIPFHEIMEVRATLERVFYLPKAELVTVRDERFVVSRRVMNRLRGQPEFEDGGFVLTNRDPVDTGLGRIIRPAKYMMALVGGAMVGWPWLMFALTRPFEFIEMELFMLIAFILMMGVFFPFMMIAGRRMRKRDQLTEDVRVTPHEIIIPAAKKGPKRIAAVEIQGISVRAWSFAPHLRVWTDRGKVDLSLNLAGDLLRNGYSIEDDYGLTGVHLARVIERPVLPEKEKRPLLDESEPGRRLSSQSEGDIKARKKAKLKSTLGNTGMLVFFLVFMTLMTPFNFWEFILEDLSMFLIMGGLFAMFGAMALIPLFMMARIKPVGYFENGLETVKWNEGLEFVPWWRFTGAEEVKDDDDKVRLNLWGKRSGASIDTSIENYEAVLESVIKYVGAESVVRLGGEGPARKAEQEPEPEPRESEKLNLYTMRAQITSCIGNRPSWRLGLIIFALMMAIAFIVMGGLFMEDFRHDPEIDAPDMPDIPENSTLTAGAYMDEVLFSNGTIVVREGERVRIVNSTVWVDPGPGLTQAIVVEPGGRLELINTSIRPRFDGISLIVDILGSALIDGLNLTYEQEDPLEAEGVRSLRVFSDDVVIRNSVFRGELGTAIALVNSSAIIEGCSFLDVTSWAVRAYNGTPVVRNSTFNGVERSAIVLFSSNATVAHCSFIDSLRGFWIWNASPTIENCTFRDNFQGILHSEHSELTLRDNTYSDNLEDVDEMGEFYFLFMMPLMFLSLFYFAVFSMMRANKDQCKKGWETEDSDGQASQE